MKTYISINFLKRKPLLLFILVFSVISCAEIDGIGKQKQASVFKNNFDYKLFQYDEESLRLPPLVEYIIDYDHPPSVIQGNHLKKTCNYSKIPFSLVNVKNWNANIGISPTTRVIAINDTKALANHTIEKLVDFVAKGGTLFIPYYCEDKRFSFLIGLNENAEFGFNIKASGFLLTSNFLPEFKNQKFRKDAEHYGLDGKNFKSTVNVLCYAADDYSYPVIIENTIGKGKVLNFNTSYDLGKMDRGILFSGLIRGLEGIPYPIVNSSTIFIDDFPSPLYDVKQEPIKSEFNLTISEYVEKVWWPDMKSLAKKYDIGYTAVPAFDYNDKIVPPFLFRQWDAKKTNRENTIMPISSWLMKDCLYNNHELGFHGYNHVSLMKKNWKNPEFMELALLGVQKKWQVSNFQDLPITYVPPSNDIDNIGLNALKSAMPSILFNCSLYLGQFDEGCDREFDYDPFHPKVFAFPRVSSGYTIDESDEYALKSLFLYTGIWNHFIHPDDVFQIPKEFNRTAGSYKIRNSKNQNWKIAKNGQDGLLQTFDNYLASFRKIYPKSRFLTARDGAMLTLEWRAAKYMHEEENSNYKVVAKNTLRAKHNYWFTYIKDKNVKKIETQVATIALNYTKTKYHDGYLFMICTKAPSLELENLNPIQKNTNVADIVASYQSHQKNVKKFFSGTFDEETAAIDIAKEIIVLKEKMQMSSVIDSTVWNQYARYLSWENKNSEVWETLEKHCIQNPTVHNIMYSKQLAEVIGYPNEITHQKWLEAQMIIKPNQMDLLNNYVDNFYSDENQEKIKAALKALLGIDTSSDESLKKYIQHLIWYEPKEALIELEKIEPNIAFKDLATNIVWLYANEQQIQKAFEWSFYSDEVDVKSKMDWLFQLEKYDELEEVFRTHIATNINDHTTKALMSNLYFSMGKFKESWIVADALPDNYEKGALRKILNEEVVFQSEKMQDFLLENYPDLFYDYVKTKQNISNRLKNGNFIQTENQLQSNQKINAALKTVHSYNFYDSDKNTHKIAATYSEFYPIPFLEGVQRLQGSSLAQEEIEALIAKLNIFRSVYGIEYKFSSPNDFETLNYWGRSRVEKDNLDKLYFQFGAGLSLSKNKTFSSAEINFHPAETAPAHDKDIYQTKLNLYRSQYLFNYFNASLAIESNYFTRSNRQNEYQLNSSFDATGVFRFSYLKQNENKVKLIPYLETSYTKGTLDLPDGFPYWTLKQRFFYGGGIGWNYGLDSDAFYTRFEGAYFIDDFAGSFQRYSGSINYRFLEYTSFLARFEFFVQDRFYSNTIQIGFKHIFKEKYKYKPK